MGIVFVITTDQKWLVVFLYPFLRKEEVKHEKIIYQSANERKIR